jgi:hypothetical protein
MGKNYRRHWDQMGAYSPSRIAYLREQEALHAMAAAATAQARTATAEGWPDPEWYYYIRRRGQWLTFDHFLPDQPLQTVKVLNGSPEHEHVKAVNAVARQMGVLI